MMRMMRVEMRRGMVTMTIIRDSIVRLIGAIVCVRPWSHCVCAAMKAYNSVIPFKEVPIFEVYSPGVRPQCSPRHLYAVMVLVPVAFGTAYK